VNIDVIVTRGTPAVLAAKKATTTTPIVMAAMGDPLMVVASLANPGGKFAVPLPEQAEIKAIVASTRADIVV